MKTGKSIRELASELQRIRDTSHDFVVPTDQMLMRVNNEKIHELTFEDKAYSLNNWSHSQVSGYTKIPKTYYDRIKSEDALLLASNVNHGFQMAIQKALVAKKQEARMVRVTDNHVRALVSSRYRRLDFFDLLEQVFPVMADNQLEVRSSELTERRMFIKAFTRKFDTEIKKGIVVGYGLNVSCSDVGSGAVKIEPMTREYICDNGMIWDIAMRKFHIGRNQAGDSIEELLTDKTKELDDAAFWAKVKDILVASMKPEIFERQTNKLREAAGLEIKNFDIPKVVELSMSEVGVTGEGTKNSIVNYLANGADGRGLNKWGLANAFTFAAQSEDVDYETATDLEKAGSKVIELPAKKWDEISG